jgi:hypothetical protein
MDARPQTSNAEPKITVDAKGKIVVEASAGVRFIGINRDEQ